MNLIKVSIYKHLDIYFPVEVPKEVLDAAERAGIDVIDLILNQLYLRDPSEGIRLRITLAEKMLNEAKEYLAKGDLTQASEKAYKAAEEAVKALAEEFNLPEYQQAMKEGRWYIYNLFNAVSKLSIRLGDWVRVGWNSAYALHAWGFHEGKLDVNSVSQMIEDVEKMIVEVKKALK